MKTKYLELINNKIVVLFVLLLGVAGVGKAQEVTIGNLRYQLHNDATATVLRHKNGQNATGSLTIPSVVEYNGATYSVTRIGDEAFYNCSGLTGCLTIGNSVTTLGKKAFYGCSGFTGSLTIPDSVTAIEYGTFEYCSGFTGSLTISNSVTSIGGFAFSGCNGFTGILTIPNSVTYIGNGAFSGCSGFTGNLTISNSVTSIDNFAFTGCSGFTGSLTIPNSVTAIGFNAFKGCSGFTGNLIIPNSVTIINHEAFNGCSGFTGTLTIPNSVTSVGYMAFWDCSGLTSIEIPSSVTNIESGAFSSCNGLVQISVADGNSTYDSRGNCNAIIRTSYNTLIQGCKKTIIPNSVTTIGDYAFASCTGLTGSLTIPNSVTTIDYHAFEGCSGLTGSLILPNSVTTINDNAFSECSGFTGTLILGNSLATIGACAFAWCGFTGSLIIPNSVTTIENSAFYGCNGITNLTIGKSVEDIGSQAFWECDNIESIIVWAEEPPDSELSIAFSVDRNIPVYVPCGTEAAYLNTWVWRAFQNYHSFSAEYYLSVTSNWPDHSGTEIIELPQCTTGETTIKATPNSGFRFVAWLEDGVQVSQNRVYSFVLDRERTLVAQVQYLDGQEENMSSCFEVYPNPANSRVIIDGDGFLQVVNLRGQTIFTKEVFGREMLDLQPGVYLISLDGITRKVIVE